MRGARTTVAAVLVIGAAGIALAAAPRSAGADVISGYARIALGLAGGKGVSGASEDDAFHAGAAGATYGFLVGVEVLFIDVFVQHDQFVDGDGLSGTWTQFMTGFDVEVDLGTMRGGTLDKRGRRVGGWSSGYAEIGSSIGFGLGTGQQVDPPLDNSEITDKAFLVQGVIGGGVRLTPWLSLGASVPVQAGYFIKNDSGVAVNDDDARYLGYNIAALVHLRAIVGLH